MKIKALNSNEKSAYVEVHIAVLLFGFTGVLGELINLSAVVLVWWRVLFTATSMLAILYFTGKYAQKLLRNKAIYFLIGCIIGLHWICFYGSVKLSNASIALICMATASFFTALTEPLVLKRKIKFFELLIGLLMIPGMYLVVQDIPSAHIVGFGVGILAAFLSAVFASYNKKYIEKGKEVYISMIEMASACIFCTPFVLYLVFMEGASFLPGPMDWLYLVILSFFCTTIAFLLSLRALNYISAFSSNLAINLEPVYGIILAIIFLNQHKDFSNSFYLGVLIIMIAVFSFPSLSKKFDRSNEE